MQNSNAIWKLRVQSLQNIILIWYVFVSKHRYLNRPLPTLLCHRGKTLSKLFMVKINANEHIEAETKWPPFANYIFTHIFLNENFWILNKVSLKYVSYGLFGNMATPVQLIYMLHVRKEEQWKIQCHLWTADYAKYVIKRPCFLTIFQKWQTKTWLGRVP